LLPEEVIYLIKEVVSTVAYKGYSIDKKSKPLGEACGMTHLGYVWIGGEWWNGVG